jgi:hypothetical protein
MSWSLSPVSKPLIGVLLVEHHDDAVSLTERKGSPALLLERD